MKDDLRGGSIKDCFAESFGLLNGGFIPPVVGLTAFFSSTLGLADGDSSRRSVFFAPMNDFCIPPENLEGGLVLRASDIDLFSSFDGISFDAIPEPDFLAAREAHELAGGLSLIFPSETSFDFASCFFSSNFSFKDFFFSSSFGFVEFVPNHPPVFTWLSQVYVSSAFVSFPSTFLVGDFVSSSSFKILT